MKEIAIAAKASWGYELERVRAWADDGVYPPQGAFVAEADGDVVAWAALLDRGDVAWLEDLWVDPAWMRRGVGTQLFRHALELARARGAAALEWEAEPNAVPFYESVGARRVRDSEPTSWGRIVPVMRVDV